MVRTFGGLEVGLSYFGLAVAILLVIRLWRENLHRTYRAFWLYLLADITGTLIGLALIGVRFWYSAVYVGFGVLKSLLYILVVLELYRIALQNYRGLATFSARALQIVLAGALIAAMALAKFDMFGPAGSYPWYFYFQIFERLVSSTLAVFLLFIAIFLSWFPLRLSRNIVAYAIGLVVFFLTKTAAMMTLLIMGRGPAYAVVSTGMLFVACCCLVFWLVVMRRSAEEIPATTGVPGLVQDPSKLIRRLDIINATLSRLGRK